MLFPRAFIALTVAAVASAQSSNNAGPTSVSPAQASAIVSQRYSLHLSHYYLTLVMENDHLQPCHGLTTFCSAHTYPLTHHPSPL